MSLLIPPCNCFPRCCPAAPQLRAAVPSPCSPARRHWIRAGAPAHAWRDARGLPCCRAGVSPAQPSSPGPKPTPGANTVARTCCTPSHAQLLPREQPHGDIRRGTRIYLCTVAAAPAHPAQLQAHTTGSSSPPPPSCPRGDMRPPSCRHPDGALWGRVAPGPPAPGSRGSSGSVLGLWWEQSLQEREQVRGEVLGGAEEGG